MDNTIKKAVKYGAPLGAIGAGFGLALFEPATFPVAVTSIGLATAGALTSPVNPVTSLVKGIEKGKEKLKEVF